MKVLPLALAAAMIAACTQSEPAAAPNADDPMPQTLLHMVPQYDDTWNWLDYWTGEYPGGIGIYEQGVEVMGRVTPHPDEPASTRCPLTYLASYHPWNGPRSEAENLEFRTAFKKFDWTISEDATVELEKAEGLIQHTLAPGDIVTVIAYHAEGWGEVEIDGQEYGANLSVFPIDETDPANMVSGGQDDEWLGLDCGKERRYVLLSDLHDVDGISVGLEGMTDYGFVSDLTEAQAAKLRGETE